MAKMNWDKLRREKFHGGSLLERDVRTRAGLEVFKDELQALNGYHESHAAKVLEVTYGWSYNRSLNVIVSYRQGRPL